MKRKLKSSEQKIIMEDCEDPEEYYYKVYAGKKNNEEWANEIPFDMTNIRIDEHKCISCGNPNMEESVNGSNCKKCFIKYQMELYGKSKEQAEQIHLDRYKDMQQGLKFAEMLAKKRMNKDDVIHEDKNFPF